MKKKTLKEQYRRERKRIQNYISRNKKKGIIINFVLPSIPKRITKGSVSRLHKITPQKLKSYAEYVDVETGKIISKTHYEEERERLSQFKKDIKKQIKELSKKVYPKTPVKELPSETDIILNIWFSEIARFPTLATPILTDWTNKKIASMGRDKFAEMIAIAKNSGLELTREIAYNTEYINTFLSELLTFAREDNTFAFNSTLTNYMEDDE